MENAMDLIVTIVNRGFAEEVMHAAKAAGARGGTILNARGAGKEEAKFFGIQIQPEKDVVLMVVERSRKAAIMQAVCRQVGLNTDGHGISFSLPVEDAIGLAGPPEN